MASLPAQRSKSQRVLACTLCQQRKVKCDRRFPCANCTKAHVQCTPAVLTRPQRKRRFPERALLDRLRRYEEMLSQNNIAFEPLHKDTGTSQGQIAPADQENDSDDRHSVNGEQVQSPSNTVKSEKSSGAKNLWHAMSQGFRDSDDESDSSQDDFRETTVRRAWDQIKLTPNDGHLLFGLPSTKVDLSTLHPKPAHIFRLWQIYLDNVNPLLKITHVPTLQARIVEAASDIASINPILEALMFSIYCISVLTLEDPICVSVFGQSKADLQKQFQFGCQQALSGCAFLSSNDRDCLTALFLYLLSIRFDVPPRSLSAMLGVAIRIAQRIGLYSESTTVSYDPLEAELRRRLWWALVMFDTRMTELSNSKIITLDPTWDCKIPSNVNDSELRSEMKIPPTPHEHFTEAIFPVVRSELGDYKRHSAYHLEYTNPPLKFIVPHLRDNPDPERNEMLKLEAKLEEQYLSNCDEGNPLHFMTVWWTRGYLAKSRLLEHHARHASLAARPTDADRDAATLLAMRWLECDLRIMQSPLVKKFVWYNKFYFPAPAHIHIAQDLKKRPRNQYAERCWQLISEHYAEWYDFSFRDDNPITRIFSKVLLSAWKSYKAAHAEDAQNLPLPDIVLSIQKDMAGREQIVPEMGAGNEMSFDLDMGGFGDFSTATPMTTPGFSDQDMAFDPQLAGDFTMMQPHVFPGMPGQVSSGMYGNQMGWTGPGGRPGWGGFRFV